MHYSTIYNMRVRSTFSTLLLNAFCVSVFLMMSACSSNAFKSISHHKSKNKSVAKSLTKPHKGKNNSLEHTHPANPCTVALAHSHDYSKKDHEHTYDCENTNDFVSNGHVHEATELNKRFRHVHPNGANKHSHHRK